MLIKCPCCGSQNSLDSLIDDEPAAQALMSALKITPVGRSVVKYLGLFRPAKKSLSWSKVAGLLGELMPMIEAQHIKRSGQDYAVPPVIWESAISKVIEARDAGRLTTPLKSHGYLLEVIVTEVARFNDEKVMAFNAKKQAEKLANEQAVKAAQESHKKAMEEERQPKQREPMTPEARQIFNTVMAGLKGAVRMTNEEKNAELAKLASKEKLPPKPIKPVVPQKTAEQIKQEARQLQEKMLAAMTDVEREAYHAARQQHQQTMRDFSQHAR